MTNESRERFDKIAENYVASEVHSMSPTRRLLHQLVKLETGASVCDVGCVTIIELEGHESADVNEFNHKLELLHNPTHV